MKKPGILPVSIGSALALAPFAWTPLAAQDAPACTGPQAVELRSVDLGTGTGRSAVVRGAGPFAHCSWTTDESGRANGWLPLAALSTLDASSSATCSLPVVGTPTEATPEPEVVEVLVVDPAPVVEGLLVWRGTARSVSRVPSWAERVCAEARLRQLAGEDVPSDPRTATGWGVPGLDEIEALVRASAEVQAFLASEAPSDGGQESYPEILREDGERAGNGARIILLDASDSAADPLRHVHLIVNEASPTKIQVAVDTGEQGEIDLLWTRSAEAPEWSRSMEI